jgi:DNA topoisomerase-1
MHPEDQKPVTLHQGRYGPYVAHGKVYASLPRGMNENEVTLQTALPLLAARVEAKGGARKGKGKAKAEAGDAGVTTAAAKPARKSRAKKAAAANDAVEKPAPKRRVVNE